MPEDLQSRFTVLDKPTGLPGHCLVCGAVDRPVVDFGIEVDFEVGGYGRAYFCVTCIKQAASKFPDPEAIEFAKSAEFDRAVADAKVDLREELIGVLDSFSPQLDLYDGGDVPLVGSEAADEDDLSGVTDDSDVDGQLPGSADEAGSDDSGEGPPRVPSYRKHGTTPDFGFGGLRSE